MLKFKNNLNILIPLLYRLYNVILKNGIYPENWSKSMIVPILKKGDKNNTDNYRGISLINVISKIFTKILNARLVKWAGTNQKMHREQAGRSTIDQIFVLNALVEKYISRKKGRFYTVYVDFSKAFDSIPHLNLWFRLINNGIHGNILCVLRSMYSQLKSCIFTGEGLSEFFGCTVGTMQGCMLSPFLFIFYLNEFIEFCKNSSCQGIYVDENAPNILMLLFADDMVECGDTVGKLQSLINKLSEYCKNWGLSVNLSKTKVMVFRNGGIIRRNEKWFLDGKQIETCSHYKYLGLMISSKLTWGMATKTLANQASKVLYIMKSIQYKCGDIPFSVYKDLYEKMVIPILCYGSEVWGFEVSHNIESVQRKFLKYYLGVGTHTSNAAVLGETGMYPVSIYYIYRCIKYWLKLLSMDTHSYPHCSYKMLLNLSENGRITWATKIKRLLFRNGYGYVWLNQGVGNEELFLHDFKKRLIDCSLQEWTAELNSNSRLSEYKLFKINFDAEYYLSCVKTRKYRIALCKLRCSSHNFAIEKGRHTGIARIDRLCSHCLEFGQELI